MSKRRKRRKNPTVNTGILFAALAGVWAIGAHLSHKAKRRRARRSKLFPQSTGLTCPVGTVFDGEQCVAPDPSVYPSPLPPLPAPPGPGPSAPTPGPTPQPTPEPTPTPTPPAPGPKPGEGDAPDPIPPNLLPLGSADDPCIADVYNRTPIRVPLSTFQSWNKAARDWTRSKYYYLYGSKLEQFVALVRQRYTSWPSLRNVVVRDALEQIAPACDWYIEDSEMGNAQQNVFVGALDLARAVEADLEWSPPDQWGDLPMGYDDEILARTILGLPAPGAYNLQDGQIIELIAIDADLRYPEHVFAQITGYDQGFDCYWYSVVAKFQGRNVAPKFTHHHGVGVGPGGCLSRTGGGAYRVYAQGVS